MDYASEVAPAAAKALRKLDRTTARRIVDAVDALAENPRPDGVKKLRGDDNLWRIRVGQYRILYEIHNDRLLVLVLQVGHRRDVYRR